MSAVSLSEAKRALLERLARGELPRAAAPPIPHRDPGAPAPLSFGQQQVWLHARFAGDAPLYNEPLTIHRRGPLDVAALQRTLDELLVRHAAWRTAFRVVDGEPVQVVLPPSPWRFEWSDLTALPGEEREREANRLAAEDSRIPIDLETGPPFRSRLVKLAEDEHRLYLTLHHLVFDGVSIYRVILPELAALYEAFSSGRPSPLAELPITYADYAAWERGRENDEALREGLDYWRRRLSGELPVLRLATDEPRPARQTFRGAMHRLALPRPLTEAVRALARREGVTLYMTLLAAYQVLLARYTGQEDILVGSVSSGRKRSELEQVVGFFLNTLVLRTDLSGDPTFRELLRRVKDVTLGALAHDDVPFTLLVQEQKPRRDAGAGPLIQTMFSLEPPLAPLGEGWELTQMDVPPGGAKFDLYVELDERPTEVIGRFLYNADLFHEETVARMVSHWMTLVSAAVSDPGRRISELPLLSAGETHRLLVEWNATESPLPATTLHALVEDAARRAARRTAVEMDGERLTYGELTHRANRLAHALARRGARPGTPVAVALERSPEMVAALLAVLKSGAAYVPLDPSYPRRRLEAMLDGAGPRLVLTDSRLAASLPLAGRERLLVDADAEAIALEPDAAPFVTASPEDAAYVIYTSGSTGRPKGVVVPHRAIVNHLLARHALYPLGEDDTFLQKASTSFDISVWEIFGTLAAGARLVLAKPGEQRDARSLLRTIQRERVTVCHFSPPALDTFLSQDGVARCRSLRRVFCGGEPLPRELAERFFSRCEAELISQYGPTEATVDVTFCRVERGLTRPVAPIGRPIANTRLYVLDRHQRPVPAGVPGELHIAGACLALGYLDDPAATAAAFVPDPFSLEDRARLYRSGDLARWLPDGRLELLGRVDRQMKVRGFRVEPGEIEAALDRHPAVKRSLVTLRKDGGESRLVAHLVCGDPEPNAGDLRRHLLQLLPEYMVPSAFVTLDAFPLDPNGKVDVAALPGAAHAPARAERSLRPAESELEARLVAIWQEVLGVAPIGTDDDFFELGGHSLLAVKLFERIRRSEGRELPLATIFQAPTIARLAELLGARSFNPSWSSLVPIQPNGTRQPFYCVHAIGGNVLTYFDLARHLGPEQPVYGLQAQGLDGRSARHRTIEEMAAHYVKEIRELQPEGPYTLGGSSFGGTIAFAMAQELVRQGEEVSLLALFDTWGPDMPHIGPKSFSARFALLRFLQRIDLHAGNFLVAKGLRGKLDYVVTKTKRVQRNAVKHGKRTIERLRDVRLPDLAPSLHGRTLRLVRKLESAGRESRQQYEAQPYAGRITLFRATKWPAGVPYDPELGWRRVAMGGLEVHEVPGYHGAIVYEPRVGELARALTECLARLPE